MPLGLSQNQSAPEATVNRLLLGRLSLILSGDTALDDTQAGNRFLDFTGTPSAAAAVTVPDSPRDWIVRNTSGQTVTVKTAAGTGVEVATGRNAHLYADGVEVYALSSAGVPEPPPTGNDYDASVLALSPSGYWELGETSGGALDTSGNGNDGTLAGGVTQGVAGGLTNGTNDSDTAYAFDGVAANLPVSITPAVSAITEASGVLWANIPSASSDLIVLFSHRSTNNDRILFFVDAAGLLNLHVRGASGATATVVSTTNIRDDAWHSVAFTTNTTNSHAIYIDGVFEASSTTVTTSPITATLQVIGGQDTSGGTPQATGPGQIQKLALYDFVLTASEISNLYATGTQSGIQPYKQVADLLAFDNHWRLDETSGATAADAAAVADGTITGGVTLGVVDSPIHQSGNKAMTFDGATGWIDLGAATTLNPGMSDFTLAMWLKSSAPASTGRPFQKRGTGSVADSGWQIAIDDDGNFNSAYMSDGSGNSVRFDNATTIIYDGAWHFIALVFTNATGVWDSYLDGAFLKTASVTTGAIAGKSITTTRNATIGAAWDAAGTQSQFYGGDLSDVKYKNDAITSAQIRSLHQAGISFTAATSISKSPALYLRLNETTGTVAKDYSFNGADGTYTGGVTLGVADSPITNETSPVSASFDGVDDVVATPYAGVLGTNLFNVRGWVKTSAAGIQTLCSWGTAAAGQQVEVSINAAGSLVADFSGASAAGTAVINDGVWHHFAVAAPATPTVADVALYVDGATDAISATVNGAQALNLAAGANVAIGRDIAGTGFGQFLMAEFAIDPI